MDDFNDDHGCGHDDAHEYLAGIEHINALANVVLDGLTSRVGWQQEMLLEIIGDLTDCAREIDSIRLGALGCEELREELNGSHVPDDIRYLAGVAWGRLRPSLRCKVEEYGIRSVLHELRRCRPGRFGAVKPN